MNSNFVVKLALSAAFVAVPAMTASPAGAGSTSKDLAKKASPEKAFQWAKKAERAMIRNNNDRALQFAEQAVEAEPQNRDYRALLARVYMAKGRFVSAERTLMDVMELGQADSRTVISLALSHIAQGKPDAAISVIDANRAIVPVSDYGLTLALAGRSGNAVNVLIDAVRADGASPRARQNLALAYALDGRWRDARVMASQDMSYDKVNQRMTEWAEFARPGAYAVRVAGLLKVRPDISDVGQPVHLALNRPSASALAMGDTNSAVGDASGSNLVSDGIALVEADAVAAKVEPPLIRASASPAKLALAVVPASSPSKGDGSHAVQLGAFASPASAQAAWNKYSAQFVALRGLQSASSTVTVNGRTLTRLAAIGFNSGASAHVTCQQIKSQGGACFVVPNAGAPAVRMAQGGKSKIATR